MKRPNITPGEWRQNTVAVKHDIHDVLDSEGATIAFIPGKEKHRKEDGKAIASLPKLLKALEDIANLVETEPESIHDAQVQRYCQTPAAWAREALIEAGYTID